jgi:hypothetical protein
VPKNTGNEGSYRTTTSLQEVDKKLPGKTFTLLCIYAPLNAQKIASKIHSKKYLVARLLHMAQGDSVRAVIFCQSQPIVAVDRHRSSNMHFSFMK